VKTETEIADKMTGFIQGSGTRDQITNLRKPMHKEVRNASSSNHCVLWTKAFYSISHDILWGTMIT